MACRGLELCLWNGEGRNNPTALVENPRMRTDTDECSEGISSRRLFYSLLKLTELQTELSSSM